MYRINNLSISSELIAVSEFLFLYLSTNLPCYGLVCNQIYCLSSSTQSLKKFQIFILGQVKTQLARQETEQSKMMRTNSLKGRFLE